MVNDLLETLPADILTRTKSLDLVIKSSRCHSAIDDLLSRTVLLGGKRLRPLLTYLVGHLFDADLGRVAPYARSAELVHAASLAHDDVIDNATTRRGRPSINILASNKKSVLAGDYLLAKVIVDLSQAGHVDLVQEMSFVIKELSEGEWLQLDLIESRDYTLDKIMSIASMKTSSVMSYCTIVGAYLTNQPKDVIEYCRTFGHHLGIAFQLIDDTLDLSTDSLKDSLLDLQNGIVNSIFYKFLEKNPELFLRYKAGEDLSKVVILDELQNSASEIRSLAEEHLQMANQQLLNIEEKLSISSDRFDHLRLILSYLALRTA